MEINNTLLNNKWVIEEIKREIKKFLETNDNENTLTQNPQFAAKAVVRGKSKAIQSYLKKQEKHQIDKRTTTTKNPKVSRRKESRKIRAEINERNNSKD